MERHCKWTRYKNLSPSIDLLTLKLIRSLPVFSLKNSLHIWNLLSSVVKTLLSLVIFNFHLDDLLYDVSMTFTELLETFGLENHVTFPTHINGHQLDLIITRSTNDIKVLSPLRHLFIYLTTVFVEGSLTIQTLVVRPRVPWYCDVLNHLKKKRRKFEKKMGKTKLPTDVAEYHKARNHDCAKLRDAKKAYYTNLIQESSGDSKKLFQVVNSLCKERNNSMLTPHSGSLQLANDFGDYFYRKITLIQQEIQRCNIPPASFIVLCPSSSLKHFKTVTQDNASKLIMSSSNATCRLDPTPTWLVKDCVNELSPIFTRMINFSLTSGSVPSIWKSVLVVPLPKKTGLELTFNNFRPVSNLSLISKVGEKVVIP